MPLSSMRTESTRRNAFVAVIATCLIFVMSLGVASAQETAVAGLIVDYGDGRVSYAIVPFEEEQINGLDLITRSGLDVVSVGFGGLGDAVCQVGDTGCSVDDCRKRMCQTSDPESPFWQFSKLDESGTWQFVATGASGAAVRDGDMYAWSWVGTTPDLPVMTLDELAERAGGNPTDDPDRQAFLRTEGEAAPSNDDSGGILAVAGIGVVVAAAAALVLRSRLPRRPSQADIDER